MLEESLLLNSVLEPWADLPQGRPVEIHLDHATTVAYVRHQGGTRNLTAVLEA